jgi:hypothetical protein
MTFFAGHTGAVLLRRSSQAASFNTVISNDDVNPTLNRVGFDGSLENLVTGDRVTISTDDPRNLIFFPATTWPIVETLQSSIALFINVNLYGGLRFFRSFQAAVNNDRSQEISVVTFAGDPLPVTVEVEDLGFNVLGSVTSFDFQTEREAVETTSLSDKFKQQYSAGLISGSGSLDALFSVGDTDNRETSLLLLQLIQRVEIGSAFEAQLFITNENVYGSNLDVYYQFNAVITRAGVEVASDGIISTSIDFLSTGEVALKVGLAPSKITLQNGGYMLLENFGGTTVGEDRLLLETND